MKTLEGKQVHSETLKTQAEIISGGPKIPGANPRFGGLGLDKLLSADELAQLIAEEKEYLRLQEIITANSHTVVQENIRQRRHKLMTSGGEFSQAELNAFTHSAEEEISLARERSKIAHVRAERHTAETVQPLIIKIYRKLLPKLEAHVAQAEAEEKALHARFGLPTDYTPVANTIRERLEILQSHIAEMEKFPAAAPDGPRNKLGLLLDWSQIEAAAAAKVK